MGPERSRTLHNFSLPPRLNWGAQKLLRCANPNDTVSHRKRRNASFQSDDDQIEVIREKLILDFRSEVDKMRAAFLGNPPPPPPPPPMPVVAEMRPWNLRTRRAACKEPVVVAEVASLKGGEGGGGEEVARAEFAVALMKEEIDNDFVEMTGRRPPRKPRKRPRYLQKHLDTLFPGLWLSEITADMYKVIENPEPVILNGKINGMSQEVFESVTFH